ncbi:hypothetical protein [Micromonospora sp. NPDC023956]|uniref:hypothetical protein n=1 Tax=Micromonospora sp. NPDC023956 TaxID=3155722 RepID=UPI0033D921E6
MLSTTPPPIRHRPIRLLGWYSIRFGLRENPLPGGLAFRCLDLLASALGRIFLAHPYLRW